MEQRRQHIPNIDLQFAEATVSFEIYSLPAMFLYSCTCKKVI